MNQQATEEATPQRKKKARQSGDLVHSRELLSAVAMMAGVLALGASTRQFVAGWARVYERTLALATSADSGGDDRWLWAGLRILLPALAPIAMVMLTSFAAALAAGIAQTGGVEFHPAAIGLKFAKLNPVTNLQNMFSLRGGTRVMKSLVPAAAMAVFGWGALKALMLPMPVMSLTRLPAAFETGYNLAVDAAWVTLVWSGLDYAVEYVAWTKRLRMSRQELKDELKEAMTNPQIKSKVRQIQNAMRRRKMKADISRASVVITNPTHYAVALEFSFETMQAPTVLAKGRDLHAAAIREEARWAGVPLVENPPLAQSLYRSVEPGQAIPFELYSAVAGILAYLYRQKVEERVRAQREAAAQARAQAAAAAAAAAAGPEVLLPGAARANAQERAQAGKPTQTPETDPQGGAQ